MKFPFIISAALLLLASTSAGFAGDKSSVFGNTTSNASEAAFIGVFYDLKQDQNHKPTNVSPEDYTGIIDDFLAQGWNEDVLNQYYRITRPVYTTQIFIPNMSADNGPKAFGAEKAVKPSRWVIHYKGQVSPPESGVYRFWGIADDVMALAVDGKTVLVGARKDMAKKMLKTNWHSSAPDGHWEGDGTLVGGDWITLSKDKIYDIDIIIGERPGGIFNAFCMIEKQGVSYPADNDGKIKFPIFQIAPFDTPRNGGAFSTGYPTWKSYQ